MACQVEQIADCGDISTLARALFIPDKEDSSWLSQCSVSLSSCGSLLAVGHKDRLCLLNTQWISSSDTNTYIISWSGTMPSDVSTLLALPIGPSHHSSQNGPDWICVVVGFKNGCVGFYTNTGHLLFLEKLDEKPVLKISCHTGTFGTLSDDIYIFFPNCECVISGSNCFQTLRYAKAQLARVQAGVLDEYTVDGRSIQIKKWSFSDQEIINDAGVVGLELKTTYDHLLAASTYGGYDTWYRSIPPANTLILGVGSRPYIGFHYALEGGTTPPLQDVARAVANKIKSALPGWLGLGGGSDSAPGVAEAKPRSEALSMRAGLADRERAGSQVAVSPDRRLAAVADNLGRVAVLDLAKGQIVRLLKGYRDAQCAFVQVFEQNNKKPQLSTIMDVRRAIFLIIYNPKKGLIDIRLMQRGNRVAVFTATKNGRLIYNTCGLVGAEQNYSHKKLNLPEFQCVLIDPDGKLKKFNIPFHFALEGAHSDRSKDLHLLRELREALKKESKCKDDVEEIVKKASELKMLDLKKHCIELMLRNNNIDPNVVIKCLEMFLEGTGKDGAELDAVSSRIISYFQNLVLVTYFYKRINNEDVENMQDLIRKLHESLNLFKDNLDTSEDASNKKVEPDFSLLEDDSCILERLLILAQEKDYKAYQHARVTFADNISSPYKDFVSCFQLEENIDKLTFKADVPIDKQNSVASYVFKAIFKLNNVSQISDIIQECNINPKEIVRIMILHIMSMPIESMSIELIEKFISVLYFICKRSPEAACMAYNESSPWWQDVRDMLLDMPCPLRSMIVAMAAKATVKIFEQNTSPSDESAWEHLTTENAKWGLLIGKLEDISILSIIMLLKETYVGESLPMLHADNLDVNLKYIYSRGKGSVAELIAKWLCSTGVAPQALVANELMDRNVSYGSSDDTDESNTATFLVLANYRHLVEENHKIFKWVSLLRQQFPFSTSADYVLANMCWEYAVAWRKNMEDVDKLSAVVSCIQCITDPVLQLGLHTIVWTTYIREVFEMSCRLVNKVGKLPKERLCAQDVSLSDVKMVEFLEVATTYLDIFMKSYSAAQGKEKLEIQFEQIWEDDTSSLIDLAQNTQRVNSDLLNLTYQISCTINIQCSLNLKVTKPLNNLFDVDYQYVFEYLTKKVERPINMTPSEKIRNPRYKFICKVIRAALDLITCEDKPGPFREYNTRDCMPWIVKLYRLAELWGVEKDFIQRQQTVGLFHLGYDPLAEDELSSVEEVDLVLPALNAIATQRLKQDLLHSPHQTEWLASVPPNLYTHLSAMETDPSVPAHPCLESTVTVLRKALHRLETQQRTPATNSPDVRRAELIARGCEVLMQIQ